MRASIAGKRPRCAPGFCCRQLDVQLRVAQPMDVVGDDPTASSFNAPSRALPRSASRRGVAPKVSTSLVCASPCEVDGPCTVPLENQALRQRQVGMSGQHHRHAGSGVVPASSTRPMPLVYGVQLAAPGFQREHARARRPAVVGLAQAPVAQAVRVAFPCRPRASSSLDHASRRSGPGPRLRQEIVGGGAARVDERRLRDGPRRVLYRQSAELDGRVQAVARNARCRSSKSMSSSRMRHHVVADQRAAPVPVEGPGEYRQCQPHCQRDAARARTRAQPSTWERSDIHPAAWQLACHG